MGDLLVVGSIALDGVETPFGARDPMVGGSAVYFSYAASLFHEVRVVGVIGDDYPEGELQQLADRGADLRGIERRAGRSFYWKGRYSYDLLDRETLETRLGVFAEFNPRIPQEFRDTQLVFLGNIDPRLQLGVLDQIEKPALVVCDTMNYWIEQARDPLLELLAKIDLVMLNDSEARELSGDWNIYRAARWILERGPRAVVIKQGVYGAVFVNELRIFYVPAYPLEEVFDPTGAGDAFAGGFMGELARSSDLSEEGMRRAMVYGAAMGSFAVEKFSVDRLKEIGPNEVSERVEQFAELVRFELGDGSGGDG